MKYYTYEEYLEKMSYLLPIAANLCDSKKHEVPINQKSTLATLEKLFKNDGYQLLYESPSEFVDKLMYNYWSTDIFEQEFLPSYLENLNFSAKQYIVLSIINRNNNFKNDEFIEYDLTTVPFSNLDDLIELFVYANNIPVADYTEIAKSLYGENIVDNVRYKTNKEIKDQKETEQKKSEEIESINRQERQNKINEQLLKEGVTLPVITYDNLQKTSMKILADYNAIKAKELTIRQKFCEESGNLLRSYQNNFAELGGFDNYHNELNKLTSKMNEDIKTCYASVDRKSVV